MDLNIENNTINNNDSFSNELKKCIEKPILFSIDRFEGIFAVCENIETNEIINIDKSLLPENCTEGDIIKLENNVYIKDEIVTKNTQEEIKNMVNNLFKRKD